MTSITKQIAEVLKTEYTQAHLAVFAAQTHSEMTLDELKDNLGIKLPAEFEEFYNWASAIPQIENSEVELLGEGPYLIRSLNDIKTFTDMWRQIQKEQPDREWREGFLELQGWDGAYSLVLDTLGKVDGTPNQILYMDYKGGGMYWLTYHTYNEFLEEILGLLKAKKYFEPPTAKPFESELYEEWGDLISSKIFKSVQNY